ncbi:MAG: PqqD family peptide modification chaperone [Actinobacteria bacterium]|nr:PqqD family peptide modification chaperone [Actinomycetota bacterium]
MAPGRRDRRSPRSSARLRCRPALLTGGDGARRPTPPQPRGTGRGAAEGPGRTAPGRRHGLAAAHARRGCPGAADRAHGATDAGRPAPLAAARTARPCRPPARVPLAPALARAPRGTVPARDAASTEGGTVSGTIRVRGDAVEWRQVDDEIVALDRLAGEYLALTGSGAVLWSLLLEGATEPELTAALLARFDVEQGVAAADVTAFVAGLEARGLLERR